MSKADYSNTDASACTQLAWNPGSGDDSRLVACRNENCSNEHVDPKFASIFGDRDGTVFACPECTSWASLRQGAAANPTFESRVQLPERPDEVPFGR